MKLGSQFDYLPSLLLVATLTLYITTIVYCHHILTNNLTSGDLNVIIALDEAFGISEWARENEEPEELSTWMNEGNEKLTKQKESA